MTPATYEREGSIATIRLDDGKANALSPTMLDAIGKALDRAEADDVKAVVLAGRAGRFSAGFDLSILSAAGPDALRMLRGGFELAERMLAFPRPIVVACTGHAIAMGVFLLGSGDYRIGAAGAFRIHANEVAIGLTMPLPALAILRYRLTPSAFDRAVCLAEAFDPEGAVTAGLLDRVVAPDQVIATAQEIARGLESLEAKAHAESKLRARATVLAEIRAGIAHDFGRAEAA
jgi:enoyl-CoA hydratase